VVVQETGTHRSKRLPARGSASEDDVRIVVLVYAEEALKCRFVTDTAGEFESTTTISVDGSEAPFSYLQIIRTAAVSGMV
jgi:hypothetical protein